MGKTRGRGTLQIIFPLQASSLSEYGFTAQLWLSADGQVVEHIRLRTHIGIMAESCSACALVASLNWSCKIYIQGCLLRIKIGSCICTPSSCPCLGIWAPQDIQGSFSAELPEALDKRWNQLRFQEFVWGLARSIRLGDVHEQMSTPRQELCQAMAVLAYWLVE